jgi:hypothetical protein
MPDQPGSGAMDLCGFGEPSLMAGRQVMSQEPVPELPGAATNSPVSEHTGVQAHGCPAPDPNENIGFRDVLT